MGKAKARRPSKSTVGKRKPVTPDAMRDSVLCSLVVYLDSLSEDEWSNLPIALVGWCNVAMKALKSNGPIPDLPEPEKPSKIQARWLENAKRWAGKPGAQRKVQGHLSSGGVNDLCEILTSLPTATGIGAKELSKAWIDWLLEEQR